MPVRWPASLAVMRGWASSKASITATPRSRPAIQSRLSSSAGVGASVVIVLGETLNACDYRSFMFDDRFSGRRQTAAAGDRRPTVAPLLRNRAIFEQFEA